LPAATRDFDRDRRNQHYRKHALRAWDEIHTDEIFPRDGGANTAAVQAMIEISSLIRAVLIASSRRPMIISAAAISTRPKRWPTNISRV
jgi:hypothetical protein